MKIQFISPALHGLLDYAAAAGLIVLPLLLGLGEVSTLAAWLSVAAGAGLIAYSLLTDYAFGPFNVLSFRQHLALDLTAAAAFFVAPLVFGWTGLVAGYYFVMASGVVLVVLLTETPVSRRSTEQTAG